MVTLREGGVSCYDEARFLRMIADLVERDALGEFEWHERLERLHLPVQTDQIMRTRMFHARNKQGAGPEGKTIRDGAYVRSACKDGSGRYGFCHDLTAMVGRVETAVTDARHEWIRQREKQEEKRRRFYLYRDRLSGMTWKECGVRFGMSASTARKRFMEWWRSLGKGVKREMALRGMGLRIPTRKDDPQGELDL